MGDGRQSETGRAREARLKAALRDNLRKRKAQERDLAPDAGGDGPRSANPTASRARAP
jgi:hypothetical protein